MSDNEQTNTDTSDQAAQTNQSTSSLCRKGSACCKPHTALYISIIALALAGYAAFNTSGRDNNDLETQMNQLDSKISNLNQQLETLSQAVQNNRDNLVQNKLKKALENIRDISGLAEEGSKAAISKVESMLQDLTTLGKQLIAPEQVESSVADPSTGNASTDGSSTTNPAAIPSSTDEQAAPESTAADATINPPAETPSSMIDAPVLTTPATTDKTSNATGSSSALPAAPSPAITNAIEPATEATPETDRSAPQAF